MGIYYISIGKGIILSCDQLIDRYCDAIYAFGSAKNGEVTIEDLLNLIRKDFGDVDIVELGHDAFTSRFTSRQDKHIPGIFDSSDDHTDVLTTVRNYKSILDETAQAKLNDYHYFRKFIFIGKYESTTNHEFEWRLKTPELVYGLAVIMEDLCNMFLHFKTIQLDPRINEVQKPLIWTFATDCACCT